VVVALADSPHWQADEQPAGGRRAYSLGTQPARVADASALPRIPRADTNAPAITIGERCADFILRACG